MLDTSNLVFFILDALIFGLYIWIPEIKSVILEMRGVFRNRLIFLNEAIWLGQTAFV
jgi:hypothetical protein